MTLGWNKWPEKFNWSRVWDITYLFYRVKDFIRKVRQAWQRVKDGLDETAYFNCDSTIAVMIYCILSDLLKYHHGVPGVFLDGPDDQNIDAADQKWCEQLKIGMNLWLLVANGELDFDLTVEELKQVKHQAFIWLEEWFDCLWD